MKNRKKKYEAQALAIVMVIMVISSIIGMSVYFRTMEDKTLSLEERASAEALEISDLLLDKLTQFEIQEVVTKIEEIREEPFDYTSGTNPPLTENEGEEQITSLFNELGIEDNIRELTICPISQGNEYQITIKEADENTYYEIKPGQTWALPIKGKDLTGCSITLKFAVRGDKNSGFVLAKSYAQNYTTTPEYKEYEFEDIQNYCFADSSDICYSPNFYETNWLAYRVEDEDENQTIALDETYNGYNLDEIRVKAVGSTIGINYQITNDACAEDLRLMSVRATANCSGVYRGKEILIPETKWHNTLFDYSLFNSKGSL